MYYLHLCLLWKVKMFSVIKVYQGGKNNNRKTVTAKQREREWHAFCFSYFILTLHIWQIWTNIHVHISPEGSERRVRGRAKAGAAPLGQAGGQCQGQFGRVEANRGFSTWGAGVQQNMKRVVTEDRYSTGMRALLCTFSLQLSSTSVLIRPSQLSLNHAGSLQHKQKHREEQQFNTEINKGNMDCLWCFRSIDYGI